MPKIPPRQKEVGKLIAQGHTNEEIAELLGISKGTVETHRSDLYARIGVDNAVDLTHHAIAKGWVQVKGMRGRPRKERGDEEYTREQYLQGRNQAREALLDELTRRFKAEAWDTPADARRAGRIIIEMQLPKEYRDH